jgi:hypothetical protein
MALFNDPRAAMNATLGRNPTAEEQEIASRIMNQGLAGAMNSMGGQQMAQNAPPQQGMPQGPAVPPPPMMPERNEPTEMPGSGAMKDEARGNWALMNQEKTVPWNENVTWGEYLGELYEKGGPEAVDQVIDEQMKNEADSGEGTPPVPPGIMPTMPTIPPAPPEMDAMAPSMGQPEAIGQTTPMPEGIMQAAGGGYVNKGMIQGYNFGGMVEAPVAQDEFMNIAGNMADQAGIPKEAMDMVADASIESAPANDNAVMDSGIMQTVEAEEATDADMTGIGSLAGVNAELIEGGQEGLIHASPGEIVFDPSVLPEDQRNMLMSALASAGIDPSVITVGDPNNMLNEMTGLPSMFLGKIKNFFKNIPKKIGRGVKKVGRFLKKNAGTILGIAGAMTGNPLLAAFGSGIGSLIEGKPIQNALLSAGLSYAGSKWVAPWIGEKIGGLAPSLTTAGGTGETIGGAFQDIGATRFGQSIIDKGADAVIADQAYNAAAQAGFSELATKGGAKAGEELAKQAINESLKNSALNLGQTALENSTQQIFSKVAQDFGGKASERLITSSLARAPQALMSKGIGGALAAPISQTLGKIGSAGLNMYAEPMLQNFASGQPMGQDQEIIDAFQAKYNYVPNQSELFQFYNTEYTPPSPIDVAQTLGNIPGYVANQGGFINGVGGPTEDKNLGYLSDGEFVTTERAVRGKDPMGLGNRMRGAQQMYLEMKNAERRVA